MLIVSCDAYKDTWTYFFTCFEKFWPDCTIRKYLVTNELKPDFGDTTIIATGKETSWSTKMRMALTEIKEETVLLLLDDYFLCAGVDNADVEKRLFEFMSYDYDYLRLMPIPKVCRGKDGIYRLDGRNMYEINLQAAIWKKSYLMQVLREDGLSAWQVEAMQKVSSQNRITGNCYAANYPVLDYLNGVIQGKWYPDTVRKLAKQGIFINTKERGLMSKKSVLSRNVKNLILHNMPISMTMKLKKILKSVGVKFVTEN